MATDKVNYALAPPRATHYYVFYNTVDYSLRPKI